VGELDQIQKGVNALAPCPSPEVCCSPFPAARTLSRTAFVSNDSGKPLVCRASEEGSRSVDSPVLSYVPASSNDAEQIDGRQRKLQSASDSLADEPVSGEPICERKFPASREFAGIFPNLN
jgi:hypothetical protein